MATAEQWYQSALDGVDEQQRTGGGIVGAMRIDYGFKVYISGMKGEDLFKTFFPVATSGKEARAVKLAEAKAFAAANGHEGKPQWSVCLTMKKDECVTLSGEPVGWVQDQQDPIALWTMRSDKPSAAKLFMAAMQEHRAPTAENFYGRVRWANDPYKEDQGEAGKTEEDKRDGTFRFPTIAVLEAVYKNKASAQAASDKFAAEAASNNGTEPVTHPWADFPGEWGDDENWTEFAADAKMALAEGGSAKDYAENELGEDLTFLFRALSVGGTDNREIKEVTGAKMKQIKAALAS